MTWQTSPTDASTAVLVDDKRNVAVVYQRRPGHVDGYVLGDKTPVYEGPDLAAARTAVEGAVAARGAK